MFLHINYHIRVKDEALHMTSLHIFPAVVWYICSYPFLISSLTVRYWLLSSTVGVNYGACYGGSAPNDHAWWLKVVILWTLGFRRHWYADVILIKFSLVAAPEVVTVKKCKKYICLYLQVVEIHPCERQELVILCCLCHGCWWLVASHDMWYWSNLHRVIQIWARFFFQIIRNDPSKNTLNPLYGKPCHFADIFNMCFLWWYFIVFIFNINQSPII